MKSQKKPKGKIKKQVTRFKENEKNHKEGKGHKK